MNRSVAGISMALLMLTACTPSPDEGVDNQTEQDAAAQAAQQNQQNNASVNENSISGTPIAGSEADASALQNETLTAQELLEQADTPLANRVIYFTYDSAKVTDESLAVLEVHGNFIASNGNVSVRLEGHADERGSREYNIALGDRRAQSVRRILLFQGASSDQIETVSYGEEQPAVFGHNEAAWEKNRRVELVYQVN